MLRQLEQSIRVSAPTLLALALLGNVACSGRSQPDAAGQWKPIQSVAGGFRRDLIGNPSQPGPFKYQLRIPAGARVAVHRHSVDVRVTVLSGSIFIVIGQPLESFRAKRFVRGNVFVVPADAWHDEWWDEATVLEAEGIGPMETLYKSEAAGPKAPAELISRVDHLVYATPDLSRGVDEIEKLLGIRATEGGQHPGRGTRNALVALGPASYLEILAPDPEQPAPKEPRPFGLDALKESRLVAWFIKGSDLERLRAEAVQNGVPFGAVKSGSRLRPDGVQLSWHFTDPWVPVADGVVPFLVDWGNSPHPAHTATRGALLMSLRAEHPDASRVHEMLRQLGLDLPVTAGARPALIAIIEGPRGRMELR